MAGYVLLLKFVLALFDSKDLMLLHTDVSYDYVKLYEIKILEI